MKKFLFILPHPDDGEVLTPHMIQHALREGNLVIQHLACCDEYGTTIDEWKGNKIRNMRKKEMENAASVTYNEIFQKTKNLNSNITIQPIRLIWGPYIDGHVPFNKESIEYYKNLIVSEKPDIVFIPDPFFPVGTHHDHINTGYSSYFALKSLHISERPKIMLMYQSFKPNRSVEWADPEIKFKARMSHRSQWSELEMKILDKFEKIIMRSNKYRFKNVEPYRKFSFEQSDHLPKTFLDKVLVAMITKTVKPGRPTPRRFFPTPEELKKMGRL